MSRYRISLALLTGCAWFAFAGGTARAQWKPPGLQPVTTTLADVLALNAKATGNVPAGFTQRHERWTYANGTLRLPVEVMVKGDDFRADVALAGARYAAGRAHGVRWRANANGIAHATLSDLQGDALDRLPQSPFGWSAADCALAGETRGSHPAWVVEDRPARDKLHWFFVDEASGLIVREVTREGARTIVTAFDRFEPLGGTLRARHWHVSGGGRGHDLDATLDALEPVPVADAALAIPAPHPVFAALEPAAGALALPARFDGRRIVVEVTLGTGQRVPFLLDTGTASIMLDSGLAAKLDLRPALEHATVPRMTVGDLRASDVSTLTVPLQRFGAQGILGYDFFFGHIVHVDYASRKVEVLPHADADRIFTDPRTTAIEADVAEGLPLVAATVGSTRGDRFAVDTGSDQLVVLDAFAQRTGAGAVAPTTTFDYLEGSIRVAPRHISEFDFGSLRFMGPTVAVQGPNRLGDALDLPFDGIVGSDELASFDCWFDYDNGRIGLRPYD